jgi:energy-coupling factor transporter ATP-binding protein EcfA2
MSTYSLKTTLPFGKHRGKTVESVIKNEPSYIEWCLNSDTVRMDLNDEAMAYYLKASGKIGPDPGWTPPPVPRKVITPSGMEITLGDEQHAALTDILKWAASDERFYTLSGYAGTGKTTIVYSLLELSEDRFPRVVVTAPTHKAKKVISRTTGKPAITVQSLLGLAPATDIENFDPNNPKFKKSGKPQIEEYDLCVIDEASMLGEKLVDYIFQTIANNGDPLHTKVIFMGDSAQLPPVNEALSPVFTSDTVERKFQLTEVHRQKGDNPLKLVYDDIRTNIEAESDQFQHKTDLIDGAGIEFITSKSEFSSRIIETFSSDDYQKDPDLARVICWTNTRVKEWNDVIREALYGESVDRIENGEVLMAYSTVGYGDSILIENSADYRVLRKRPFHSRETILIPDEGQKNMQFGVLSGKRETLQIDMWSATLEPTDIPEAFRGTGSGSVTVNIVVPDKDNYTRFRRAHDHYIRNARRASYGDARKAAWQQFYRFRENHLLLDDVFVMKEGKKTLVSSKNLSYAYAITTHKSQGSTYAQVFVDETDIDKNREHRERNSLKYVAFSRPSSLCTALSRSAVIEPEARTTMQNGEASLLRLRVQAIGEEALKSDDDTSRTFGADLLKWLASHDGGPARQTTMRFGR